MNFSKELRQGDIETERQSRLNTRMKEDADRPLSSEQKQILQLEERLDDLGRKVFEREEKEANKQRIAELKLAIAQLETELKNAD